jgi:hypothetical protein
MKMVFFGYLMSITHFEHRKDEKGYPWLTIIPIQYIEQIVQAAPS